MSFTSAVVMLCGPHDEGDRIPTRRIDQAIRVALNRDLPLFIAGDAFRGREIARFYARAQQAGVQTIFRAYDSRRCTLSDAQAVAHAICAHQLIHLLDFHLTTDWWHMDRAREMLVGETAKIVGHEFNVIPVPVTTGPHPSQETFRLEAQGLRRYKEGTYGVDTVIDPFRQCHSAVQES